MAFNFHSKNKIQAKAQLNMNQQFHVRLYGFIFMGMEQLLNEIFACRLCEKHLAMGARPVVTAHPAARIVVVGQAPGLAVHRSGIPWDDKSGDTLRNWMQVDKETFYNPEKIALIPMGFCYPGRGKSGDLPPRRECAPRWHHQLLVQLNNVKLMVLVGKYAQSFYLGTRAKPSLTETAKCFEEYLPQYFVLPHSSPRNNIWQVKNDWFIQKVIPRLQNEVVEALK
jgi:uracil-DNA glycosylase